MKKFLAVLFLLIVTCTPFMGCAPDEEPEKEYDPTKEQLYIGNTYGAFGDAWLKEAISLFEQEYPDVQVWVDNEKDLYSNANLIDRIDTNRQDLYILGNMTYYNYVNKNKFADITDIVTKPMNENTVGFKTQETQSIQEKMKNDSQRDFYETDDGKYFAVPHYDAYSGLIYDVDLFEEKKYYFNENETGFVTSLDQKRSKGPDGEFGTVDDGLPASVEQFKQLCDRMVVTGTTPFTWAGKSQYYMDRFLNSVWASVDGLDNFNLNNSFSGAYTFAGDSQPTPITEQNAYLLQNQKGKTVALQLAKVIASDSRYISSNAILPSQSNTLAQDEFLLSRWTDKRIGMLIDAAWWENEANTTFEGIAAERGEQYSRLNRKFAFMPTPYRNADGTAISGTLYSANPNAIIAISNFSQKKDLAKRFLLFLHSDEAMRIFTRVTGVPRAYKYDMTEEDLGKMSYFARSVWDLYSNEDTQVAYEAFFTTDLRANNTAYFKEWAWGCTTVESQKLYRYPIMAFRDDPSLTVEQYQAGMVNRYSNWDTILK